MHLLVQHLRLQAAHQLGPEHPLWQLGLIDRGRATQENLACLDSNERNGSSNADMDRFDASLPQPEQRQLCLGARQTSDCIQVHSTHRVGAPPVQQWFTVQGAHTSEASCAGVAKPDRDGKCTTMEHFILVLRLR
eukprot:3352648-Amphidinium_carterae.1